MNILNSSTFYFDRDLFLEMEKLGEMGMFEYLIDEDKFLASPHFKQLFKLPERDFYPISIITDLIYPEDYERVMKSWTACIEQKRNFDCEYRYIVGQAIIYIRSRARVYCNELGEAVSVLGIKQDISRQKKNEQEREKIEQRYRVALKNSPVIFARVDTALRYEWILNPHQDFDEESVRGKRDDELTSGPGIEALMKLKQRVLEEKRQMRELITFAVSDGAHTYDITATPLLNAKGEAYGLITALLDVTEQRKTETALQSAEDKLEMALKAAQAGVFDISNHPNTPPVVSESVKALFGFPIESDPLLSDYLQRIHPEDRRRVNEVMKLSFIRKEGIYLEYRVVHPDGKEYWLASRNKVMLDNQGRAYKTLGTLIDITDRKRDEETLRKSRRLARERLEEVEAIYDSAPIGLCVLDTNLRFVRINQRLAEINGFPPAYHLGKTVREIVPDFADEVEPVLRGILETGEAIYNIEINGETASMPGVQRNWVESWIPFKNSKGEVRGINIVAEEVTEKKRIEAARRSSEDRYQRLFYSIEDGFCVCEMLVDEQGRPYDYRFLEVNHTFESHTGLKDAAGKTALELVPKLETYWFETYGKVALEGKSLRFEQGSQEMGRWFDVYAFPFGEPGSRIFALHFKDISERKKHELEVQSYREELARANQELAATNEELLASNEELRMTNEKLRRVNTDLDNFVYTASHDLKAPITNLYGLMEMLNRELSQASELPSQTQRILEMMDLSVDRFMKTIADMTDISRLQKQGDLPMEEVLLAQVVNDVRMDLAMAIEQSEAILDINLDLCGTVRFAPKNLRSIIYNLLSNAIKYRDPERKPIIRLRCEPTEGFQVLSVSDNGLGINLNQSNRLFGMFQRLHAHVEGTGVGLYIVKKMLENAGGKIEVESEVGVGTTFKVFFKR
ncbi:MAG: PAS domain-containing protein [Cyclobacteriaceae bacterium]